MWKYVFLGDINSVFNQYLSDLNVTLTFMSLNSCKEFFLPRNLFPNNV
jgi:hypothetical protein